MRHHQAFRIHQVINVRDKFVIETSSLNVCHDGHPRSLGDQTLGDQNLLLECSSWWSPKVTGWSGRVPLTGVANTPPLLTGAAEFPAMGWPTLLASGEWVCHTKRSNVASVQGALRFLFIASLTAWKRCEVVCLRQFSSETLGRRNRGDNVVLSSLQRHR